MFRFRNWICILTWLSSAALADDVCSRPLPFAPPSPLVTGNGFGYAVVSRDGRLKKFLAHPYSVGKPKGENSDAGVATANFIADSSWSLDGHVVESRARSLDQTQVIAIDGDDLPRAIFSPFALKRNVLVVTGPAKLGFDVRWEHKIAARTSKTVGGTRVQAFKFKDVRETLLAIPLFSSAANVESKACLETMADRPRHACFSNAPAWAFVSLEDSNLTNRAVADVQAWAAGENAVTLVARETNDFAAWTTAPACLSNEERALFRHNETILRLAQIREENTATRRNHGLINASLPDGEFVVPFVRDMAYATAAFSATNHRAEARSALLSYFNAVNVGRYRRDTNGLAYQISIVRYFGDGTEHSDRSGQEQRNLEFDNWGLVLWVLGEFHKASPDRAFLSAMSARGRVYENARDFVAKSLLGNLETAPGGAGLIVRKDNSVWEQNDEPRRNYAASTIAAIAGLKNFIPVARFMNDDAFAMTVEKKVAELEKGFRAAFFRDGKLVGAVQPSEYEDKNENAYPLRNEIDGALLEAVNFGVLTDEKEIRALVKRVETELKAPSGGWRRTNGPTGYERQEFVFIGINLARTYLRLHDVVKAEAIMKRVRDGALKNGGLIPEMIQSECMPSEGAFQTAIGSPSGAIPMAGYGAGAYNLYVAERQALAGVCSR